MWQPIEAQQAPIDAKIIKALSSVEVTLIEKLALSRPWPPKHCPYVLHHHGFILFDIKTNEQWISPSLVEADLPRVSLSLLCQFSIISKIHSLSL